MKKTAILLAFVPVAAQAQFALHSGDRVVFYGDSITDQRLYTLFTEAYVRTRYPKMRIDFVHSGWGGDRVSGGGGGPIDTRLARDVFPYKPTVMTIMLGMNDAGYRAFDPKLFDAYRTGYEHILSSTQAHVPGVRFTLIQPSPYDDVTRAPGFEGGYNGVLGRYSEWVGQEAQTTRSTVADLNAPVVAMLQKANATDPANAQKILPDRVHPGPGGHLIMAEALLRAWNATPIVSSVAIRTEAKVPVVSNTVVTDLKEENGTWSWTQKDEALPFPLDLSDPVVRLAVDSSDFLSAIDMQPLSISGLDSGRAYDLFIDDAKVASFTGAQLASGVNLAPLPTPMLAQAREVLDFIRARTEAHNVIWRNVQVPNERSKVSPEGLLKAREAYEKELVKATMKAAEPKPRRFRVVPTAG